MREDRQALDRVAQMAETARRLNDQIDRGEVTVSAAMRHQLEGVRVALDAVLGRPSRLVDPVAFDRSFADSAGIDLTGGTR